MKKWIPLLVLLHTLTFLHVKADHIGGGEITYKATTTPGVVEVHFVFYRDCLGIPVCTQPCGAPCTRTLNIMGADPGWTASNFGTFSLSLSSVRDLKDNYSGSTKNYCTNMGCVAAGMATPAYERYEFVGLANIGSTSGIPASCCNIRFMFTECCRSTALNTGSSWQNFYIDATLNRCQYNLQPNSSPTYVYDPLMLHCGGQPVLYNLGAAYDPDGDSLSYAFAPALQAYGSSVTYTPPWAYNKPMPWSGSDTTSFPGGIRCDPATGIIAYTPGNASSINFYGVICIEIKQWKNISGVPTVVGKTYRDFQNIVLGNCPMNINPSVVSSPPNTQGLKMPKLDWIFPAGVQTCFSLMAKDTDYLPPTLSDTAIIDTADAFADLGGVFTRFSPLGSFREDSMRFCWTPPLSRQSNSPYVLTVRVRDSRTPIAGRSIYAIKIYVPRPLDMNSVTDSTISCNTKRFKFTTKAGSPTPAKTDWSVRKLIGGTSVFVDSIVNQTVLDYTFADTGSFQVNAYAFPTAGSGLTVATGADTVKMSVPKFTAVGTDTILCKNTTALLGVNITGGKSPYTALWLEGLTNSSGLTKLVSVTTQNKMLTVTVTDSMKCKSVDTVKVQVFAAPVLAIQKIADTVQCEKTNQFKLFNNTNDSAIPGMSYTWFLDNVSIGSTDTVQFSLNGTGQHTLRLLAVTAQGCRDSVEKKLYLFSSPKAAFVMSDTAKCKTGSFTCTNQSTNSSGTLANQWDVGFAQSALTNFTFTVATAGAYAVKLFTYNTLYAGCSDTVSRKVYVYPKPSVTNTINAVSQCLKQNNYVFTNTTAVDPSITFNWLIDGDTSTAMVVKKSFATAGTKTVKLKMTSLFGCNDSLSKTVTVLPSPTAMFTVNDSDQCVRGNSFVYTNASSGATSFTFTFDGTSPATTSPITKAYTGLGFRTVKLIVVGSGNCRDTIIKKVELMYTPTAAMTLSDTVFCKYKSIVCNSSGLNSFQVATGWSFTDQTSDTGITVSKRFNAAGLQKVSLRVVTDRGCADSLTRNVFVNTSPPTPLVNGPKSIVHDSVATYSLIANSALTYDWLIENGSFVSTNLNSNAIDLKWSSSSANGRLYSFTRNASGCLSDTTRYDVSIIGGVGIADMNATFQNLTIFPNPTTDAITISLNSIQAQRIRVTLYNIVGTEVKTISYTAPKGMVNEQLNLHDLQKGIYFMRIEGESGSQTVKVMLK